MDRGSQEVSRSKLLHHKSDYITSLFFMSLSESAFEDNCVYFAPNFDM